MTRRAGSVVATAARALAVAAAAAVLASCGQKGPLVLAKPVPSKVAPIAEPSTTSVVPAPSPASAPGPR